MNRILVVIDMQKDFVDGVLGSPQAQGITENVTDLVQKYEDNGWQVLFTKDTHSDGFYDLPVAVEAKTIPRHCIRGSEGWDLVEPLRLFARHNVLEKPSFLSLELGDEIEKLAGDSPEILMCGVCTDICVISNALYLRGRFPSGKITVRENCCAGTTTEAHQAALTAMKSCLVEVE